MKIHRISLNIFLKPPKSRWEYLQITNAQQVVNWDPGGFRISCHKLIFSTTNFSVFFDIISSSE